MIRTNAPGDICWEKRSPVCRSRIVMMVFIAVLPVASIFALAGAQAQDVPNITVNLGILNTLPRAPVPPMTAPQEAPTEAPKSRLDRRLATRLGLLPDRRPPFLGPTQPLPPPEPPVMAQPDAQANEADAELENTGSPEPAVDDVVVVPPENSTREAALAAEPREELVMRIAFLSASAILQDGDKDGLREIALAMQSNGGLRLKLLAYAARETETELFARRLSLSRSLAVRNFLIAEGVEQTRITVQALGATQGASGGGETGEDRVDAFIVRR